MDSLEKVPLENEIFKLKALGGRDILNQQSALVLLERALCHAPQSVVEYPSLMPWAFQPHS